MNADPPAPAGSYRLTAPRREAGGERRNCRHPSRHFSMGRREELELEQRLKSPGN